MIRTLAAFSLAITVNLAAASEPIVFPKTTIDIGMVVTDLGASVAFYTDGIGFKELAGFQVDSTLAGSAGLTDNQASRCSSTCFGERQNGNKAETHADS